MGFIKWDLAISAEDLQIALPICISFPWGWLIFQERYSPAFSVEDRCGEQNWLPVFCKLTRKKGSHYMVDTVIPPPDLPSGLKDRVPLAAGMLSGVQLWTLFRICLAEENCLTKVIARPTTATGPIPDQQRSAKATSRHCSSSVQAWRAIPVWDLYGTGQAVH